MSLDTFRIVASVKGAKVLAAAFGFLEAFVFIVALAKVLSPPLHLLEMFAYAGGFAGGTFVGTYISGGMSSRHALARIISLPASREICSRLREKDFAVTRMQGEGRDGAVDILFTVMPRGRQGELLEVVRALDERAFVVFEPIERAEYGYVPQPIRETPVPVRR